MTLEEAIKILTDKVNMADKDIYIEDLDKTNIDAIKLLLEEEKRKQNLLINNRY